MFDPPLRAAVLSLGFQMRLYTRDDVAAWVSARVIALDVLPDALLELGTLARKDERDIVRLLEELEPRGSAEEIARLVVGVVRESVKRGRIDTRAAIDQLLRCMYDLPFPDQCEVHGLDDAYDLAVQGVYGDVASVHRELLALLERY